MEPIFEKIRIEPVCENDAAFLHQLMNDPAVMQALHEVPTTLRDWADAIGEWAKDEDEEDYIVFDGERPIGWLGVNGLLDESRTAYLKMAAFLPEYQGRGYGTFAILELMRILKHKGVKKVVLYTDLCNVKAQACYKKCGFEVSASTEERMTDGRTVPRLIMAYEYRTSDT